MSVRTWFSISALVLVVLAIAFVLRFFAPVPAPEIVARVGSIRVAGQRVADCWPQRDGKVRCETRSVEWKNPSRLRGKSTIHVVVAYPVQPQAGSLALATRDGHTIVTSKWTDSLPYDLPAGDYSLRVRADYPNGAYVDYAFPLTVTTSGS
jgi:hypothetical protein